MGYLKRGRVRNIGGWPDTFFVSRSISMRIEFDGPLNATAFILLIALRRKAFPARHEGRPECGRTG
jgi:hypothetical protein